MGSETWILEENVSQQVGPILPETDYNEILYQGMGDTRRTKRDIEIA